MDMPRKRRPRNREESRTVSTLDRLQAFEDFNEKILPALREDLASDMSSAELRQKYANYIQAAQITAALMDPKAAAERKDILDRLEGKATEKREIKHRFDDMPEEELKALVQSAEEELEGADDEIED